MAIMRWDLQDTVNQLFGDSLAHADNSNYGTWLPPVEIFEKDETLVLRAEMPGMKEQDIEINVENGILTLRGEKKQEKELDRNNVHRAERCYGTFVRTFALPTTVDTEKIKATYKDGVLELALPKSETAKAKKIVITA